MRSLKLLVVVIISCCSCNTDITTSENILNKFNSNRREFELLLFDLKNNPTIDSLYASDERPGRKKEEFPPSISLRLSHLGISEVYLHAGKYAKPYGEVFVFKTNWNSQNAIMVDNNPYDSLRTITGYYNKDANNNEFWGLGNSWQVYKEVKPLDAKQ